LVNWRSTAVSDTLRDINRDYWMNTQEALAYGIIDNVVGENRENDRG
jgi:ATP-dependent protease ClpP protease subunit